MTWITESRDEFVTVKVLKKICISVDCWDRFNSAAVHFAFVEVEKHCNKEQVRDEKPNTNA